MNRPGIICLATIFLMGLPLSVECSGILAKSPTPLLQNDTIPPFFSKAPQNRNVRCDDPEILIKLEDWYNVYGGAIAEDNSDSAVIVSTLSLQQVFDLFEISKDTLCGPLGMVSVGFFALDSCQNSSVDTLFAQFSSTDNIRPQLIKPAANMSIDCNANAQEQVRAWIDSIGGAEITDNCSDTVEWYNYIWVDNFSNAGNGIPGSGPYVQVNKNTCFWQVTISFLARDECGNNQITSAVFTVTDTVAPFFIDPPADTVVNCSFEVPGSDLMALDNCSGMIVPELVEESSQLTNPEDCSHYNYTIKRTWQAQDGCGLTVVHTQMIDVIDTLAPSFRVPDLAIVYCPSETDTSITGVPLNISDDCDAAPSPSFTDSEETIDCEKVITRFWQITDACGSASITPQTIIIRDTIPPSWESPPESIEFSCDNRSNPDSLFLDWVANLAYSAVAEECSDLHFFIAVPDSYILSDPETFPGTPVDSLDKSDCFVAVNGRIRHEEIDVVFYDDCFNTIVETASFSVIDSIAPVFLDSLGDITISLDSFDCNLSIAMEFPAFEDNCLSGDGLNLSIGINGTIHQLDSGERVLDTLLPSGHYEIVYRLTDCGGNITTTMHAINIFDGNPPNIQCPETINVHLDSSGCTTGLQLPLPLALEDNCKLSNTKELMFPATGGHQLLEFSHREEIDAVVASDFTFKFIGISPTKLDRDAILEVTLRADLNDTGEFFQILGENDQLIGQTSPGTDSCNTFQSFFFSLDKELFDAWSADGEISLSGKTNLENISVSEGVNPCGNLDEMTGSDGISMASMAIRYEETHIQYYLEGATGSALKILNLNAGQTLDSFQVGETRIFYIATDHSANSDTCSFSVSIIDSIAPTITCISDTIMLDPSMQFNIEVSDLQLVDFVEDNCRVDTLFFEPDIIPCAQAGVPLEIKSTALDIYGNAGVCISSFLLLTESLQPSYTSGLCAGDTLWLFSNFTSAIPDSSFSFEWRGPNDFLSFEKDPVIADAGSEFSGLFALEILSSEGCIFSGSVQVKIIDFDQLRVEVSDNIFCQGDEIVMTTNDLSGNSPLLYEWFEGIYPDGELVQSSNSDQLVVSPGIGEYNYFVRISADSCVSPPSAPAEIQIVDKPVAEVKDLFLTLCEEDTIFLQADNIHPEYEYHWTGPAGYSSDNSQPEPIANISLQQQGFYELFTSTGTCNSDTVSTQVVIFDKPEKPQISGEGIYCSGNFIILTVSNIFTALEFHWYKDGELFTVQNTNTLIIPSASSSFNGNWSVFVDDGLCQSDTSELFKVSVEDDLSIGVSSNSPICDTDSISLLVSSIPFADYSWTGPGGFTSEMQNPSTGPIEGEYHLTVTSGSGCSQVASTFVEVLEQPVITALSNSAIPCNDGSADIMLVPTVFPPGDYEYIWTGPNEYNSSEPTPVIPNYSSTDNGIYRLRVSNGACISELANTLVNTSDIPSPVRITSSTLLCRGSDLEIAIQQVPSDITEYIWTTPKGQFSTAGPAFLLSGIDMDDRGNYSVRVSRRGCVSDPSNNLSIDIVQEPAAPIASFNSPLCEGMNLQLSTSPVPGANYQWTGPNNFSATARNPIIFNVSDIYTGAYSVRMSINGCMSAWSEPIQVEIEEIPESPLAINENLRICENSQLEVMLCVEEGSFTPGDVFQWVNSSMDIIGESNASCMILNQLDRLKLGRNELFALKKAGNCFSDPSNQVTITVDTVPAFESFAGNDQSECEMDFIRLDAKLSPGLTGEWSTSNGAVIEDINDPNTRISSLDDGTNFFIWSISLGQCIGFSSDTVAVYRGVDPELSDDTYSLEYNEGIKFNAFENDLLPADYDFVLLQEQEGLEYQFGPDGNFDFHPGTNFVGTAEFIYEICSVQCPELCDLAIIRLEVGDQFNCFAPNIITPNEDGINDAFVVPCLESGTYPTNEIIVFNQWGNEVFRAKPYLNDWEGTYKGNNLPPGTYFYVLNLGGGFDAISGFVLIEE